MDTFQSPRLISHVLTISNMHPHHHMQSMPMPTSPRPRPKRATAHLDAAARARLAGREPPSSADSSGSEPEAALSGLVTEYLFDTNATVASVAAVDSDSDAEDKQGNSADTAAASEVADEIRGLLDPAGHPDALRLRLVADVEEAMQEVADLQASRQEFRRAMMARLRERGHDAGLCKVRWHKSSRLIAGSHEYIDVVSEDARYVVDACFAAQFEVARSTEEYKALCAALPEVLVTQTEELRRVVVLAAASARRSLKSRGLSVPPWRKRRFLMAKWFGPYRRTVNVVPAAAGAAVIVGGGTVAVCRKVVGFASPRQTITPGIWGTKNYF